MEIRGNQERNIAVEVKDLKYTYSKGLPYEKEALVSVNMLVYEGEAIGILGHTGSGKSTLIQHLNGILMPESGEVKVFSEKINNDKKFLKNLRRIVGIVFQFPEDELFAETVYEDVSFGPKNLGLTKEEIDERVLTSLIEVGLNEGYLNRSPFSLSGGEKRRVAIASTLSMKPKILVLDEPTSGLDPLGREEILKLIKRLKNDKNVTIILVSHSMEDVLFLVDRVYILNKGKVVFGGDTVSIFKDKDSIEKFDLSIPEIFMLGEELKKEGFDIEEPFRDVEVAKKEIIRNLK
ncbi:MAG TPA: energy-coupling factor transporter ATPase [Caldisericia bacterium]|nr:energy-coupling factor transporter ATPase [Caldisericia bacterium]HOL82620.1 energy-coupling factor transporter ATPase [Caldisericia bacterium]HPC56485.1 energy-coupling factor transporter ATPase [Caldisericia bacterium]HPP43292.1 energy-coupling factor transporter ATPase [Caldisericia bacterium]HRT37058.1 energy-coupling factor transporter ATPase [Caldisericia bacterium]